MSDYISRQAAIEAVEKCQQYKVSKEDYAVDFAEVKTELMLLPTADVVEVVRCKDCKHWHDNTEFCDFWSGLNVAQRTISTNYCSYGEGVDK